MRSIGSIRIPSGFVLGALLCLGAPGRSDAQWYIDNSAASSHIGGPARLGPYSTRAQADAVLAANAGYGMRLIPGGSDVAGGGAGGSGVQPLNPALQAAAQQLGTAIGQWIRTSGARSLANAQQQQRFMAEVEARRQEAERLRLLELQRRRGVAFNRLRSDLKGSTVGDAPSLRLKDVDAPAPGGLALKVDKADALVAPKDCRSTGIPGLPGLYLSDCGTGAARTTSITGDGDPAKLARAAQGLTGAEQALVETKVLELAQTNAALIFAPDDADIQRYRAAESIYQKSLVAEAEAARVLDAAKSQTVATQELVKLSGEAVTTNQVVGQAPPPQMVEAMNNLALVARTTEEASVRAEEAFNAAGASVVTARTGAIRRLGEVGTAGSASVIDLSDKAPALLVQPLRPVVTFDGPVAAPTPASSPVVVTPCGPIGTGRDTLYNRGLVLGLTGVGGLNVPPGSRSAEELCREGSRQFRMTQASAAPSDHEPRVSPDGYDFIVGMAQSVDVASELARTPRSELGFIASSVTASANYPSLRGRAFRVLECHSNGAMICLHALRTGDITAGDVRLFGPQITEASLAEWSQLIRDRIVNRVDVYWVSRDPVPFLALGFVRMLAGPLAAVAPLASAAWPDGQRLATTIARYGNLGFHTLPCPIATSASSDGSVALFDISCHNARFYQDQLILKR
jgi:hypothetical protein